MFSFPVLVTPIMGYDVIERLELWVWIVFVCTYCMDYKSNPPAWVFAPFSVLVSAKAM